MVEPSQESIDEVQLRMLRLGYLIAGGTLGLYAAFGIFYALMGVAVGTMISHIRPPPGQPPPPQFVGWIFTAFGLGIATFAGCLGALRLHVARCLRERRSRDFCVIVAAISCLEIPYGTALGVLTFSLLGRPSVRELFRV